MLQGHEPAFSQPPDDLPDGVIESVELERQSITIDVTPPVGTTPRPRWQRWQPREGVALRGACCTASAKIPWKPLTLSGAFQSDACWTSIRVVGVGYVGGQGVPGAARHAPAVFSHQGQHPLFARGRRARRSGQNGLCAGLQHRQPAVRATAAHLLGILGDPTTAADLADALPDPVSAVRVQAANALGRLRIPGTATALVGALRYHDEALASQVRQALLQLGPGAIPALTNAAHAPDVWVRWHVMRVLGELHDLRSLHPLVEALADEDYAVAWMAARALASMGAPVVEDVLRLLLRAPDTPRLMETAGYVLRADESAGERHFGPGYSQHARC